MVGELITLPLRASGAAVRLWWRAAGQAMSLTSEAAGFVIERVSPGNSHPRESRPPVAAPNAPSRPPVPTPSPALSESPATPTQPPPPEPIDAPSVTEPQPAAPAEEPTHVSEEPTLVEEFAEPGAEDGVGPELHIREPWEGYRHMTAREVTARLSDASAAELAEIQLYETNNRGRETILTAVTRQLRAVSVRGPNSEGGTETNA